MTHTPGPWRIVRIDGELVGSIFRGKTRICAGIIDDIKLHSEAEANAHLIAAAPEMLEALEWLMEEFDRRELGGEAVFCGSDMSQVRTVIRKARGEA